MTSNLYYLLAGGFKALGLVVHWWRRISVSDLLHWLRMDHGHSDLHRLHFLHNRLQLNRANLLELHLLDVLRGGLGLHHLRRRVWGEHAAL